VKLPGTNLEKGYGGDTWKIKLVGDLTGSAEPLGSAEQV
jgi:hypothetical protein